MIDFFARLFDTNDFPARWSCGRWEASHGWLHIGSDIAIFPELFTIGLFITLPNWRERPIAELVKIAKAHAGGRIVSILEGGYEPHALARSVIKHLDALLG